MTLYRITAGAEDVERVELDLTQDQAYAIQLLGAALAEKGGYGPTIEIEIADPKRYTVYVPAANDPDAYWVRISKRQTLDDAKKLHDVINQSGGKARVAVESGSGYDSTPTWTLPDEEEAYGPQLQAEADADLDRAEKERGARTVKPKHDDPTEVDGVSRDRPKHEAKAVLGDVQLFGRTFWCPACSCGWRHRDAYFHDEQDAAEFARVNHASDANADNWCWEPGCGHSFESHEHEAKDMASRCCQPECRCEMFRRRIPPNTVL